MQSTGQKFITRITLIILHIYIIIILYMNFTPRRSSTALVCKAHMYWEMMKTQTT